MHPAARRQRVGRRHAVVAAAAIEEDNDVGTQVAWPSSTQPRNRGISAKAASSASRTAGRAGVDAGHAEEAPQVRR